MKTGENFTVSFTADIPFLSVVSLAADGVPQPETGRFMRIPVDSAGGGVFRFTIHFSLSFTEEAKKDTAFRITLKPFFPGTLMPVSLRFVEWLSGDRIRMEWEGVEAPSPGADETDGSLPKDAEAHYYRLVVPGGKGGITTENGAENGIYMAEDAIFYLEAIR
jgi:hypothetical protein